MSVLTRTPTQERSTDAPRIGSLAIPLVLLSLAAAIVLLSVISPWIFAPADLQALAEMIPAP
jgi:hypothetical protein